MRRRCQLREEKIELEAEAEVGGAGKDPKYVPTYAPEPVFGLSSDHLHPRYLTRHSHARHGAEVGRGRTVPRRAS